MYQFQLTMKQYLHPSLIIFFTQLHALNWKYLIIMNNKNVEMDSEEVELEQSQIINQKFRELLRSKDAQSQNYIRGHKFNIDELQIISQRFNQLCSNGKQMNYQQFRRGLGLLGRQDSFICRIFNLIDEDGDGLITEQNYINYLNIILKGNNLQKSRFGWLILTENKGDLEFKDFMELFQQISVVWNALTGEIITPKRKYIEQLFNTFDVDQDQSITFQDYRLFFNEHLMLFGWFEYFNNIDIDEEYSKHQLEKVREKLRSKLQLEPNTKQHETMDELKLIIKDSELQIQKKLAYMAKNLQQSSQYLKKKHAEIRQSEREQEQTQSVYESNGSTANKSNKSSNTYDEESSSSIKSLYKYSFEESVRNTSINKIHLRKQKFKNQNKVNFNIEVANELKGFLNSSYKIMEMCHKYRDYKQKQKKYSPTKLKQMQVKLHLFDKQIHQTKQTQIKQKQKMTVYFGHQNWNLVLNIMVGLRKSIKALYSLNSHLQINDDHFKEHHQFFLGNKSYLSGKGPEALKNMENFQFISIAPIVFQRLRTTYGVTNNQYQRSVGPESLLNQLLTGDLTALNEKCSTGKSGAFFYLSSDNKIFLKTITKGEFTFFTDILRDYYQHVIKNPDTLIVRTYGLYKLKIYVNKQKINTIYFLSMENIFSTIKKEDGFVIDQIYDLKGSLYGRKGGQGSQFKDEDWIQKGKKIRLPQNLIEKFKEQIKADSKFLKKRNINDYSLMIAFVKHNLQQEPSKEGNIFKSFRGGVASRNPNCFYILSIIDILTVFETRKNLQYLFKTTFLSKDVSCIPPSDYCVRFRQFIYNSVE